MNCSVSVLIPVYNRKKVLVRAIESVLNQTRLPDEIIIADDASDYDIKSYINEAHPEIARQVKVVRADENKGVSGARNLAFSYSKGMLIALLDSDDQWHPEKLEKQLLVFENNPAPDVVSCRQWIVRNDKLKEQQKVLHEDNLLDHLTTDWHPPNPSTLLLRRELLQKVPFNEGIRYLEDLDWWLRLSLLSPKVKYVDDFLIYYYLDEENRLSLTSFENRFERIEFILQLWKDKIIQLKGEQQYKRFREYILTYNAFDVLVISKRSKNIRLFAKVFFKYLWNKKAFYLKIKSKI